MTSTPHPAWSGAGLDLGLLAPVRAGDAGAGLDDAAFVQAMLDVEHAWLVTCVEAGLAGPDAAPNGGSAVDAGSDPWRVERYDLVSLAGRTALGGNALIPLLADLRTALREDGHEAAARAVHLGATSQDVIDTALMMLAARAVDEAAPALDTAAAGLADLALRHRDDVCVARSLGQHALPTTFGARAGAWLDGLGAASADLAAARSELGVQWAGAAGTSADLLRAIRAVRPGSVDVLEERRALVAALAGRLGLAAAAGWHTTRRPVWRLGAAIAGVLAATGTLGRDVVTGTRPEVGELREPAAPGRGGSSAMPHKRNPVLAILLRSAAVAAPGYVATLFAAGGDADGERPSGSWHAEWAALRELLRLLVGTSRVVAELAVGLEVDIDAGRRNLRLVLPDDLDLADVGDAPRAADAAVARHRARGGGSDPASPAGRGGTGIAHPISTDPTIRQEAP